MVDIKKEQEREELHDLAVKRFPDAPQREADTFSLPTPMGLPQYEPFKLWGCIVIFFDL